MNTIDDTQVYKYFLGTLENCGTFLLNCKPQDIEYYLFEEFDGDCVSFLHETTLSRLLDCGYISPEIYSKCQLLNEKFRCMENTSMWNVDSVKTNPTWHAILLLSDDIKSMIQKKGGHNNI